MSAELISHFNITLPKKAIRQSAYLQYFKSDIKSQLVDMGLSRFIELYAREKTTVMSSMTRCLVKSSSLPLDGSLLPTENVKFEKKLLQFDQLSSPDTWIFLPIDPELGTDFLEPSWDHEDQIFCMFPEIPYYIYNFSKLTSKSLKKTETILFRNVTCVGEAKTNFRFSLEELHQNPQLDWDEVFTLQSDEDHPLAVKCNFVGTYLIPEDEEKDLSEKQIEYNLFKMYLACKSAKQHGAKRIVLGGTYFDEHVGKLRSFMSMFYIAAWIAEIDSIEFYLGDNDVDRTDEIIGIFFELDLEEVVNTIRSDPKSEKLLTPNHNAIWEYYERRTKKWKAYPPNLIRAFESASISKSRATYSTAEGEHLINFNKGYDKILSTGTTYSIRRVVYEEKL